MSHEDRPEYEIGNDQITKELAVLDGEVILIGHSLGGSILLRCLSEETLTTSIAVLFLLAPPY
ncbi:alpha/beta hydrolase [Haladaptatus pallidirubidus]|uniref:alpha/beta hydrolase n=1 Tax=Haladaptatus pallidirubidus TaxID=1008152 RepID=UPI001D11CEB1